MENSAVRGMREGGWGEVWEMRKKEMEETG